MRDTYGAITNPPAWISALLADVEKAGAWETGIESDKRLRGTAINTSVYGFDGFKGLAVVQLRQCIFRPGRYNKVRKDYYLVGRNETGTAFAHPIDVTAGSKAMKSASPADAVLLALSRIWDCDPDDVQDIVRNGDVAFVPARIPADAVEVPENGVTIRESHHFQALAGAKIYRLGETYYVKGRAKIEHAKGQHPTVRTRGGSWRVQAGIKANTWGFSRPTVD